MVANVGAGAFRLQRHFKREPLRIDGLAIEILEGAHQPLRVQAGQQPEGLVRAQAPMRGQPARAGQQPIQTQACRQVPRGPRILGVGGQQERLDDDLAGEFPQEPFPVPQGFAHERKLEILQVAQAAMDQAGGPTGDAGTEIAFLQQGGAQAAFGGSARQCAAVDAPADDDQVIMVASAQIPI